VGYRRRDYIILRIYNAIQFDPRIQAFIVVGYHQTGFVDARRYTGGIVPVLQGYGRSEGGAAGPNSYASPTICAPSGTGGGTAAVRIVSRYGVVPCLFYRQCRRKEQLAGGIIGVCGDTVNQPAGGGDETV
jgi:hypothetical protein